MSYNFSFLFHTHVHEHNHDWVKQEKEMSYNKEHFEGLPLPCKKYLDLKRLTGLDVKSTSISSKILQSLT